MGRVGVWGCHYIVMVVPRNDCLQLAVFGCSIHPGMCLLNGCDAE